MPAQGRQRQMYYIPKHQIEILLPLFYNDGTPVESGKIDVTVSEIVEKFGGCRITSGRGVPAFNGYWLYESYTKNKEVSTK